MLTPPEARSRIGVTRRVFLGDPVRTISVNGRAIPLGIYVAGIKKAISLPDATFPHGLTSWWSTTGAEIRRQFLESVHEKRRLEAAAPLLLEALKGLMRGVEYRSGHVAAPVVIEQARAAIRAATEKS